MSTRQGVIVKGAAVLGTALLGTALLAAGFAGPVGAQVSGRVVLATGPVGASVVFGGRPAPVAPSARVVYPSAHVARYRPGMSLRQLDIYIARIEREYDFYRNMRPHEARRLGWSVPELRHYVRWLRDERRWLREERDRLTRDFRYWDRVGYDDWGDDRPGRGRGRGR